VKPDDFVVRAAQLPAYQGTEWPYATRFNFELLGMAEVGIFGVEDANGSFRNDCFGLPERNAA